MITDSECNPAGLCERCSRSSPARLLCTDGVSSLTPSGILVGLKAAFVCDGKKNQKSKFHHHFVPQPDSLNADERFDSFFFFFINLGY